ncbi:MAG: hypothetical protein HY436_01555 [Candidatus Liptonbacteria bacterium]|nr:hypothetical protein [Candidatus Liptonbacteria bacterium]
MRHGGIRGAELAVLQFESKKRGSSIRGILAPCNRKNVRATCAINDFTRFVDNACGLIRRLESAAWVYEEKSHPAVRRAYRELRDLIPAIRQMRQNVRSLKARTILEQTGKEFLLYKLSWALRILMKSLPAWGY